MRVNLFIDKDIKDRIKPIIIAHEYFYKGGDWHEFFKIDGIEYCLTKAELNLDDEINDFALSYVGSEFESNDRIEINTEANWLQQLISWGGITAYEFAQRCDIPRDNLYKIINRNTKIEDISLTTAVAIAKGLGITTVEFITTVYNRFKAK